MPRFLIHRRRRHFRAIHATLAVVACAAIAYVATMAWYQSANSNYQFVDIVIPRAVDCLVFAWLFWVGSAVGSFLNVVAWRMPRGVSINGFSHCPRCNTRLAAQDNWPVFGWISLNGRCRTCRLPISPRYPLVELAVGISLTTIGMPEAYGGLANLPYITASNAHAHGPLTVPIVNQQVLSVWLFHTTALASSWAFGLIRFDGHRIPRQLAIWCLSLGSLPMVLFPILMVVPWYSQGRLQGLEQSHLDAFYRVLSGMAAAVLFARIIGRHLFPNADMKLSPNSQDSGRLLDLIFLLAIPGIVVGWQALIGIVLVSLCLTALLSRFLVRHRDPLSLIAITLPVVLTVQIALWQLIEQIALWPSTKSSPLVIIAASGALLMVSFAFSPRRSHAAIGTPASEPTYKDQSIVDESEEQD